jgi:hypothetical protein
LTFNPESAIITHTTDRRFVMKRTDIAYIAGLVDGEGCIRIKKTKAYKCQGKVTPSYHAVIQIRMVDEQAIKFIAETLGGWYYREKPSCNNGRPLYCYQASDKKVENILRVLLPYLRVKELAARKVLELRELQNTPRKEKRTKIVGYKNFPNSYGTQRMVKVTALSDEYIAKCDTLYEQCKSINAVGVRIAV